MISHGKKGSIINICSTYGLNGPDQRIYMQGRKPRGLQAGLLQRDQGGCAGLYEIPGRLLCGDRDRVNALTPGGVFNEHDETFVKNYSSKTILGRMARKDEMNGALVFAWPPKPLRI